MNRVVALARGELFLLLRNKPAGAAGGGGWHVGLARSVHAGPDDVVITQGAQQALDLIAGVLVDPGDVVAVEEPGYRRTRVGDAAGYRRGLRADARRWRLGRVDHDATAAGARPGLLLPTIAVIADAPMPRSPVAPAAGIVGRTVVAAAARRWSRRCSPRPPRSP